MVETLIDGTAARVRLVGRVALYMVACAVGLILAGPLAKALPQLRPEVVIGTATSLWALGLTRLFVRWEGIGMDDVGAAPDRRSPLRWLAGFALGTAILALWAAGSAAAGPVSWTLTGEADFGAVGGSFLAFVALACREELAFHGYPLRRLERSFGAVAAQLLVAIVFIAEHRMGGMTWQQAFWGPGVGSLLFGMASIATRGLAVPIGLHAGWNLGHWALGLKGGRGLWTGVVQPGQEDRAEIVAITAYVALFTVATIAFWLWKRQRVDGSDAGS